MRSYLLRSGVPSKMQEPLTTTSSSRRPRPPTPRQQGPPGATPQQLSEGPSAFGLQSAWDAVCRVFAREWPLAVSVTLPCTGVWFFLGVLPGTTDPLGLFVAITLVMIGGPALYQGLRPYERCTEECRTEESVPSPTDSAASKPLGDSSLR